MSAEAWAALFSGVAVAVTILLAGLTYVSNRNSEETRKAWELDQDTKRQGWAKDLQDRQNTWQLERDKELRAWEEEWRQKQENWHDYSTTPHLRVGVRVGRRPGQSKGHLDSFVVSVANNVGLIPIHLQEGGSFRLPDGAVISMPHIANNTQYGNTFDLTDPNYSLEPGASVTSWWRHAALMEQLRANGYTGKVEIRARYVDQIDNHYESAPLELDTEAPSPIIDEGQST